MANVNAPIGLRPVRQRTGALYTGGGTLYYIAAGTNQTIYVGDPVIVTGVSDAFGIPGIQLATAGGGNFITGSFGGIATAGPGGSVPIGVTRDLNVYHPANINQYVTVHDDPEVLFAIQENNNMGANAASSNVDLIAGAGSNVTGYSGWMLNSATVANTATLQIRVLRILDEPDNLVGQFARWLCTINRHSIINPTGV